MKDRVVPGDTYQDESWLRTEYVNKKRSTVEIAEDIGVSASTVSRWLGNFGINTRASTTEGSSGVQVERKIEFLKDESWLREQYGEHNRSKESIASELGVSSMTVSKWINKHRIGIPDADSIVNGSATDGAIGVLESESWLREQYHDQGKTPLEIATDLCLREATVRHWLSSHGLSPRDHPEKPDQLTNPAWLRKHYRRNGETAYQIANRIGVHSQVVYRHLERYGIETSDVEIEIDITRGGR